MRSVLAGLGVLAFATITILQVAYPEEMTLLNAISPPQYLGTVVAALAICVVVLLLPLFDRIQVRQRAARIIRLLSEASFGVFLVHLVVILVPFHLLPGFRTQSSIGQALLAYAFTLVVSFAISLCARRIPIVRMVF
jgi:peptidoglycan/LPS O-acetylase OafA/YrhL